jgi:hypothetical protein
MSGFKVVFFCHLLSAIETSALSGEASADLWFFVVAFLSFRCCEIHLWIANP